MRIKVVVSALVIFGALALTGIASGSPGTGSLASANGGSVYMVAPEGGGTVVTKIRGTDRTAQATGRLRGSFEIPETAGVKEGLSHDGGTLVLADHPAAHVTQFALLDTSTLRVRRMLTLQGTYSFDALSADASKLYVIRFFSSDGSRYAVQVLNLNRANAVPRTVVEKGEPGEAMAGQPVSRTTSRDGAWVYTLYAREGEAPFVHALATADTFTVCIDLDGLAGRRDIAAMRMGLNPASHALDVTTGGKPVARIDTESFEVTTPAAPPAATASAKQAPKPKEPDTSGTLWWLVIAAAGLALAGAAAGAKHLQKRPNATQI